MKYSYLSAHFQFVAHAERRLQLDGAHKSDISMGTIDADLVLARRHFGCTARGGGRGGGGGGILGHT